MRLLRKEVIVAGLSLLTTVGEFFFRAGGRAKLITSTYLRITKRLGVFRQTISYHLSEMPEPQN